MQFLILGLLFDGPHSLYDVHKRFTGGISLFYAASFGSIQHALRRLGDHDWVTVEDAADSRRRKKLYTVTDRGRQAWDEWMRAPITAADAEPMMLAKIYLLGHLPKGEQSGCLAAIRARVVEDADALVTVGESLDIASVPDDLRENYRYQRATLDYGIRSHSLMLEWIDELEAAS